ncbi:MAG: hypothetical protein Rubg2KO_28190 [Rubricoccaceae bacterium]
MTSTFQTPAWRLIGLTRSEPGVLSHSDGRLSYRTDTGVLFDVPLSSVSQVVFPWVYFGGGVKLAAGGDAYRFSFVEPNDAPSSPLIGSERVGIAAGRRAGAEWKRILAGATR